MFDCFSKNYSTLAPFESIILIKNTFNDVLAYVGKKQRSDSRALTEGR